MRQHWQQLRQARAGLTTPLPWAPTLGTHPADPADTSAWLTAATAVAAYRERYEIPDHTPCSDHAPQRFGRTRRPPGSTPVSKPTATSPNDSNISTMTSSPSWTLGSKLADVPRTDTTRARRAQRRGRRRVDSLERRAENYLRWRRAAEEAASIHRQIALEHQRSATRWTTPPPASSVQLSGDDPGSLTRHPLISATSAVA